MSNFLHDRVQIGDRLTMSLPFGDVVLDDLGRPWCSPAPASASPRWPGCSPTWRRPARTCRSRCCTPTSTRPRPLRGQVLADIELPGANAHVWYERGAQTLLPVDVHAGVLNLEDVKLPDDALYYLCGPLPFMQAVRSALIERDVAPRDIQYEVFGPDLWQADLVTEDTPEPAGTRPAERRPTSSPGRRRGRPGPKLTEEEARVDISAMRANFAKAAANGDEAPLYFYSHLFLSHPETRQMFPVSMAHQRDRLFSALGDVVARVDDLDALVPILQQLGRDHRKFGTLAAHYPAVGGSLLATLEHFDDEWSLELAKDWTEAYTLVAEVMIAAADEAAEEPAWWDADVARPADVRRRCPACGRGPATTTWPVSRSPWRPICGRACGGASRQRAASDGLMELHVKARDGGLVSSALVRRVGVGDVIRLGPPLGHLSLKVGSDRDLLLVAGGMGLAPLKAMIDQVARYGPARRVDLFVGFRTEDQIYDRAELHKLMQENPG